MKWLTFEVQHSPGFRLNLTDVIFIGLLIMISVGLYQTMPEPSLYLVPLYLGFSFFLFCNVFRIGNRLEIVWYVPFTLLAMMCLYQMNMALFWFLALVVLEPIKWLLIGYRIYQGPYVGVFSKRKP